jgi:DNA polymerase
MEVFNCETLFDSKMQFIQPKVVCALGRISAQTLLKTDAPLNTLRGKWHNYHGIPLRVTYHPAYLLRNPADKKNTWIDIKEIMKLLKGEITVEFNN